MADSVESSSSGIHFITRLVYSVITLLLLVVIYSYIDSLEKKGCKCALPSNINFVKNYTIFAIIYFLFTAFIPHSFITQTFGSSVSIFATFLDLIFNLVFIYYIYEVFKYTRALVNEKCKCSVDVRREIIMVGSLIEFALIFILFLFQIIIVTILGAAFTIVKNVGEHKGAVSDVIRDPIGSISKVPQTLKEDMATIGTYVKKTGKELSKIASKRKSK